MTTLTLFTPLSGSMSHKESPGAASECLRRDGGQEPPGDGASCAASLGGGASLEGGASDSLVSIKAQVKLQGDKVRELKAESTCVKWSPLTLFSHVLNGHH